MKRITRMAFLLIWSSCTIAVSSDLLAQQSVIPPLVDGKTNPELIDDSLATDNFVNIVLMFEENSAGGGNAYLNKALETVDQDYSELIGSFVEYRRSKEVTATTSELQIICSDPARTNGMSNRELLETFTQIHETNIAVSRDKLRSDAIRVLGQDKYDQLITFIETETKSTMKIRYSVNFSDYPDETLDKLDRAFILQIGCK